VVNELDSLEDKVGYQQVTPLKVTMAPVKGDAEGASVGDRSTGLRPALVPDGRILLLLTGTVGVNDMEAVEELLVKKLSRGQKEAGDSWIKEDGKGQDGKGGNKAGGSCDFVVSKCRQAKARHGSLASRTSASEEPPIQEKGKINLHKRHNHIFPPRRKNNIFAGQAFDSYERALNKLSSSRLEGGNGLISVGFFKS
jgi:hypothetical protein